MRTRAAMLIAFLLVVFAFTRPAFAEGPGWVYNVTVTGLVNTANGGFNVRVQPQLTGCTSQSGYGPHYASVYPSHPGINRMKADLLVAMLTGTPVALYLGDATCMLVEMRLGE